MANLGGNFTLRVTPEELKAVSAQVTPLITRMANDFSKLSDLMNRTAGYWIGDAGETYRKTYKDREAEIQEMIKRLQEHPADLLVMAGVYEQAENANVAASEPLPSDAIF